MSSPVEKHGWTAVPRSLDKLLAGRNEKREPWPVKVEDLPLPEGELVGKVMEYAKSHLPAQTFNHSMRVFCYGRAITLQHFPEWTYDPETLFLTALLHDIGTTDANQSSTQLSFEFKGAFIALDLLASLDSDLSQREAVCESIIRHQDLGDTGSMTTLTAVIHFATVLDNVGLYAEELVHPDTMKNVTTAFPRNGWTGCFAGVVRRECETKPWANTTRIQGFAEMVEANGVMAPFD
ncbi:cyanamide hydratase [Hortaea werneckii]|uniref:HD domain-containing protein n=1 Tax=Hortaea werneckii TaxID=91943 RepID=A0A3M7DN89_HORWE|nr:cyanamide hydratase [Hortaea werneckii]KAI7558706.1 cyanamide hydratase [Hortaea werneckii]KAI7613203.1 cyanamide hydratase [Hortaea werneckii]KAI7615284.1 cyanamide hydratase [Hortaea werneckii]KAI7648668.1 cyanamide hydratase [Hortaea werneckii]